VKDYEKIQALRCPVDHFKIVMGLKPKQYEIFTMLKKRVLDTAVDEINEKTDVQLSYELEREGRKVVAILFKFTPSISMQNITTGEQELIKTKLKTFELTEQSIQKLIEHHNIQYLLANIAVVEKQMRK